MSEQMKNGDMPAMPYIVPSDVCMQPLDGMTKRELIAMHLMSGLMADSEVNCELSRIADMAVIGANELLAALERNK